MKYKLKILVKTLSTFMFIFIAYGTLTSLQEARSQKSNFTAVGDAIIFKQSIINVHGVQGQRS